VLGKWLDGEFRSGTVWTLSLLSLGIGVAVIEVYLTLRAALHRQDQRE